MKIKEVEIIDKETGEVLLEIDGADVTIDQKNK